MGSSNQCSRSANGQRLSQGSVALPALGRIEIFASLVMYAIALVNSGIGGTPSPTAAKAAVHLTSPTWVLVVTIRPESKLGSDGKKHDAYSHTDFAVQVGRPLTLRIDNTDNQPHGITSTEAGWTSLPCRRAHLLAARKEARPLLVALPDGLRYQRRRLGDDPSGLYGWLHHRGVAGAAVKVIRQYSYCEYSQ